MATAIRSKLDAPFRRDGVLFSHEAWRIVPSPTERQLAEPALEVVEIDGPGDPALRGLPVQDAPEGFEDDRDEDEASFGERLDDYLADNELSLVRTAELHAYEQNVAKLKGDMEAASRAKEAAERDLAEAKAKLAAAPPLGAPESAPIDPNPALVAAIDAVLAAAASNLERLPDEALDRLCAAKGIDPAPEGKAAKVEALKAAVAA